MIKKQDETEPDDEKKKKKKKKKKAGMSTEQKKLIALIFSVVVILVVSALAGFKLIQAGYYIGFGVIAVGFVLSVNLLVSCMNKFKIYEKLTDMTKKSYEKESVKLDEDMEKCQGRIQALDQRAEERAKDAPPPGA